MAITKLFNYFKTGFDEFNNFVIANALYETDRRLLRDEFISDWNQVFATNWTELDALSFFNSAKLGTTSSTDMANSNLYRFFNNSTMKKKWAWLLDYLDSYAMDNIEITNQIEAMQGNGTNNGKNLFNASHLIYSITNFFNKTNETGSYSALDFTVDAYEKYQTIALYNNAVYTNYLHYQFVQKGSSIMIPKGAEIEGYRFVGYYGAAVAGANYTVTDTIAFVPRYILND
ncbi:MAG TPA: hypothetical protein PK087_04695 [Bacilli bacterium]|nr:hypothetical protein [Bacilli bacterium]